MNCSKCKGSAITWTGDVVKVDGGFKAVIAATCSTCKRTYKGEVDWKTFRMIQIGGFVGGEKAERREDPLVPCEVGKLVDSLVQQMEMPGVQDPRGR